MISDTRHFQEANRQLYETFRANSEFAKQMEELYPGINNGIQPRARGSFSPYPPAKGVTWHHNAEREGVLQLVNRSQHKAHGFIQKILHPDGRGGMEIWGGGR